MIQVTEEARLKIQEVLRANPGKVAKIVLTKGGCAGTMLALALGDPDEAGETIEAEGIKFLISSEAKDYASDISIEMKNSLGSEIIIRNLKATICRCGKSFRV